MRGVQSPGASRGFFHATRVRLRHYRETTVDGDRGARDEVRGGRGEEYGDAGEVVDVAPAPRRGARQHALVQARDLLARAAGQIGVDPARQDRIDLDVVGRPGIGAGARVLHDAALARRV